LGRRFRIHLSYANVVATVALFVAMGGSSYAAFALPQNSVGTRQLKSHAVTPKKIAASTVALFKGKKGNRGPIGPPGIQGPPGIEGPRGSQGPTGPSNSYFAVVTGLSGVPSVSVPAGDYAVSGVDTVGLADGSSVNCVIQVDGADAGPFASADAPTGENLEVNVADSASLHLSSPATVSNACGVSGFGGTHAARSVMAIKVGNASP
jgi:hypothetical protein